MNGLQLEQHPEHSIRISFELWRGDAAKEIEDHTRLYGLEKDHIVGVRGASMRGNDGLVHDMERRYTLFIEYTDRGDLGHLIEHWK
jgi:hypothetical protein